MTPIGLDLNSDREAEDRRMNEPPLAWKDPRNTQRFASSPSGQPTVRDFFSNVKASVKISRYVVLESSVPCFYFSWSHENTKSESAKEISKK